MKIDLTKQHLQILLNGLTALKKSTERSITVSGSDPELRQVYENKLVQINETESAIRQSELFK